MPFGQIRRVSIEGFRSLKKVEQLELPQLAVLIGANGVGKSSFIRFFEMLSWMLHGPLIAESIGLPRIRQRCPRFDQWISMLEQWGAIHC